MNPPLIVHILYRFDIGGLESVLVNMINSLPQNSYRHTIISLTESSAFASRIQSDDVEVICLHKQAGNDVSIYLKIWQLLRTLNPAIVHTYNIATLEYNMVAFFAGVKKRIHAEHGRDIYDLDGSYKKYQILRRLVNPFVSKWVAVSKELADWLVAVVKLPARKVQLIYNGIDLALYQPKDYALEKPYFIVGTVGRMAEVKDQLTLIKAVDALLAQCPDLTKTVRVQIIGDGELHDSIARYISDHHLHDIVSLLGAREDVAALLPEFDVFVLSSLAEGIPLTILEAMATALPIIATEVGGNPELITAGENGFLIPPKDIQALAERLKFYIDHHDIVQKQGLKARVSVEKQFSLVRMTEQYLKLYAQ